MASDQRRAERSFTLSTDSMDSTFGVGKTELMSYPPRPPAITIPRFPNHHLRALASDSTDGEFKPIHETVSEDSFLSDHSSNSSASLLFSSKNSFHNTSIRIPEARTKTPRTPQSARAHRDHGILTEVEYRRRTRSPVDEMCLGPVHQSPAQYMVNRYKASTPKADDFVV